MISGSPFRASSNRSICALVSLMLAFCGRVMSTSTSGRSEAGKNCCWTWPMPTMAAPSRPTQEATVTQRKRIAGSSRARKPLSRRLGLSWWPFMAFGRILTPMSGANRTATTQETRSEAAITTNSE